VKKILFVAWVLTCMSTFRVETAYAQHIQPISLYTAVRNAATEFYSSLERGSRVAVVAVEAASARMSSFIIDEMIIALTDVGGLTVANRSNIDQVAQELYLQTFEEIDEATVQLIGRYIGAQAVVTGAFKSIGNSFHFRAQIIEVETAAILNVYTANVQNDRLITFLQGKYLQDTAIPPVFTVGQRLGTWAINSILPGFGSFIVMGDIVGGVIQLASAGLGWSLLVLSYDTAPFELVGMAFGPLLVVTQIVTNIVRSATYTRYDRVVPILNPESLNISFTSRRNRVEMVSLSYTIRF